LALVVDTEHDHAEHDQIGDERQEQPWIVEQEPHANSCRV
jgi:hypothetical protein